MKTLLAIFLSAGNDLDDSVNTSSTSLACSEIMNIPSQKHGLLLFYTNADTLLYKFDEFKARIKSNNADIIVTAETYPKTRHSRDISKVELHLDGYNLFLNESTNLSNRGIAIYVTECISSSGVSEFNAHSFWESVGVQVGLSSED